MQYGRIFAASVAVSVSIITMLCTSGCGVAYQAAAEHRAAKMQEQLQVGMTPGQVAKQFGEPDIETHVDDSNEIWSYGKRANSNDVAATMLYTSAKAGDAGTFEDLKFTDGKLVSWGEAQHTMAEKEGSGIQTTIGYGRGGGGRHGAFGQGGPNASQPGSGSSDSSDSSDDWYDAPDKSPSAPASGGRPNPLSVTF
jgi:hypothetical protein